MADYLQDNIEPEEIERPARKKRKSGIGAIILVLTFVVVIAVGAGIGVKVLTADSRVDYSGDDYSNVEVPDTSVPIDEEEITIDVTPRQIQQ
ncbi:MAG: hypothetical protein AAFR71_09505 [Pseudomonadota bacterium]